MHFFLTSQNSLKIGKTFRYPIFLVWIVIGISVIIKIHSVRNIAWIAVSFSLHTLAFYISYWLEIVFCHQIQPTWSLRKNVHDCTLYWERSFQIFHAARDSSIFLMERRSWELDYDIIIFNLFRMLYDHIFNIQFLFLNSFNFWASLTFLSFTLSTDFIFLSTDQDENWIFSKKDCARSDVRWKEFTRLSVSKLLLECDGAHGYSICILRRFSHRILELLEFIRIWMMSFQIVLSNLNLYYDGANICHHLNHRQVETWWWWWLQLSIHWSSTLQSEWIN